jgi:hypothetical protein
MIPAQGEIKVKSKDAAPKSKIGSLLALFQSEYFTLDMNVMYLNKRMEEGVQTYLINKLYTFPDHEVSFYIAQLTYFLIRRRSPHIEKFILDKCVTSITLFLKIFWCLKAYGQAEKKHKKHYEYVETLISRVERAMVNGSSSPDNPNFFLPEHAQMSDEALFERIKEETDKKKLRSEYLADTLKFVNILVTVSLKLKQSKAEERKKICKGFMHRLNKWMNKLRRKHATDKYYPHLFKGICLPFGNESGTDNSTMIVNIMEDEIACFNTKKASTI